MFSNHGDTPIASDDLVQYAQLINNSAEQLLAIINDILDISKMQSGRYTLDNSELSLNEIVETAADQRGTRAGRSQSNTGSV